MSSKHITPDGEEIEYEDGFRPRRKRAKGWLDKAIKDGFVADPDNPIDLTGLAFDGEKLVKVGANALIIDAPVATASGNTN